MSRSYPRLPVKVGKAHMKLIQAIITGDDDLARWVRLAVDNDLVLGDPAAIRELEMRLDEVLVPEQDAEQRANVPEHQE